MSGNTTVETVFGVVARSETLAVLRIDFAVAVVVDAIAAGINFTLARGDRAEVTATAGLWIASFAAATEAIVWRGHTRVCHGIA